MYLDSPSKLAHEALDKPSEPGPGTESFQCAYCGHKYDSGGYPFKASPKFNNHADTFASKTLCQHCKVTTSGSDFILQNKCAVYSEQGVWSLNKDIDLAAFIYYPPLPPFLAVYGVTKQQHLVWRTPVSNSSKLFSFRIGDHLYTVDRDEVIRTARTYKSALEKINKYRDERGVLDKKKTKPLPSFFAVPTSAIRSMDDPLAFQISFSVNDTLEKARIDLSDSNSPLQQLAKDAFEGTTACIKLINNTNYAEFFLALACTKNSEEDTKLHAQNRLV